MSSIKDNPFTDKNGNPIVEQLPQFLAWERAVELERRKTLSREEVAELEKADEHLAQKMSFLAGSKKIHKKITNMCTISDKIIFCTCASPSPLRLRHYWVLHRATNDKQTYMLGQPYFPDENLYLFDHEANKLRLENRLHDPDAFDFAVAFQPADRFEIVLNNLQPDQRVTYYFSYSSGTWRIDEETGYFDNENYFDSVMFGKLKGLRTH